MRFRQVDELRPHLRRAAFRSDHPDFIGYCAGHALHTSSTKLNLNRKRSMSMNTTLMVCAVTAGLVSAGASNAAVDEGKATQLAAKYNCQACHALDKKVVGP